jgi:FAD/FMN-containing dehydrogenase
LNSAFDALLPKGLQLYWKADNLRTLSDEVIAVHETFGPRVPTLQSTMHIYPTNGAAQRVDKAATAYPFRDTDFCCVIAAMYPDPADTPANKAWVRDYFDALHPVSAGGSYVNFLTEEGEERIAASYGANYARLAQVKRRYDPGNLFHVNQNIRPA